mgnify:CR=1 FL=1
MQVIEFCAEATLSILVIFFCFYVLGALGYMTYTFFKLFLSND